MKSVYIICFLLTSLSSCRTQQVDIFHTKKESLLGVKSRKFTGTIFTEKYDFLLFGPAEYRFTPTPQEIWEAEHLISNKLNHINKNSENQTKGYPRIEKNLPNYFRQYIGLIDTSGAKTLYVKFYWNKRTIIQKIKGYNNDLLQYDSEYTSRLDGGSYYWQVEVNLTKKELNNLSVNGFG